MIFFASILFSSLPLLHKGYTNYFNVDNLVLARNLSLTGEYKSDNEKNVVLSSEIVKEKGVESGLGNKLTPVLYSKIFNIFGFHQEIPVCLSIILFALANVLLVILANRIFNSWLALIFGVINIFLPVVLAMTISPGLYEWAILFFSIALLFYLYKEKASILRLIFASLFFGLASLALNAFGLSFIPFLIYELYKHRSFKRLIIFGLPFFLLWGLYLGQVYFKEGNINNWYLTSNETTREYMHLFPDPYTWHFERDVYIESIKGTSNNNYNEYLIKYGYPVSLKNKILMYWHAFASYPQGIFAQTVTSGPLIILFLLGGAVYLYKNKKYLMTLFLTWGGLWYLLLAILKSDRWGHFAEIQFLLVLLISLGIYWLFRFIYYNPNIRKKTAYFLILGIFISLVFHFIQSDKWMFHENYENSPMGEIMTVVKAVENYSQDINKKTDIIAVGIHNQAPTIINWYDDFSCVYFDSNTIKKLLKENKLQWAFDQFGITKVVGYGEDLTDEIIKATNVEAITIP